METLNLTNGDIILEFIYLVAALFFVVGLKLLSNPDSARRGNLWAAAGMIMAMIATMVLHRDGHGGGRIGLLEGASSDEGDGGGVATRLGSASFGPGFAARGTDEGRVSVTCPGRGPGPTQAQLIGRA